MNTIRIVDTTLRDGQQSLWAVRMRTGAMLPAMPDLDAAGFEAMEFCCPYISFPRAIKDLHEYPWDWMRLGTQRAEKTPLRLHGAAGSYYAPVPTSVQQLFLQKLTALGITMTRTSDPWNDFAALAPKVESLAAAGIKTVVNLIYSVSPRHTVDYYTSKTKQAVAMRPYRICFKDVGGLLTPESAAEVLPAIVANAGDTTLEFHAHCTNGFAPYVALMAAEAGFHVLHTAVPPLSDGSSQPSVFDVVPNLRARGFDVPVDLEPLRRVSEHFHRVADLEGLPVGTPNSYDEHLYEHQIPGGMISNLRHQMRQIGVEHKLAEALNEATLVRKELGYPIMVTPLAQFVGSQAVLNVVSGGRYETVTDEVIKYAYGRFGQEAVHEMDPDVRAKILDRPRARELAEQLDAGPDEPTLDEVRQRFGGDISDEELLVRVIGAVGDRSTDLGRHRTEADLTYDDYLREQEHPLIGLLRRAAAGPVRTLTYADSTGRVSMTRRARSTDTKGTRQP